jgi:hypothetical protein
MSDHKRECCEECKAKGHPGKIGTPWCGKMGDCPCHKRDGREEKGIADFFENPDPKIIQSAIRASNEAQREVMAAPATKEGKKYEKKENPTRKEIEEALSRIGWELRHHGCEHWFFYNHRGVNTGMFLLFPDTDARICFEGKSHRFPNFTFYLKDCTLDELDGAVSFAGKNDKSIFILCPNYDK